VTTAKLTHKGQLRGDARSGGHEPWIELRLTPSGSHWVDKHGRKWRASNGWAAAGQGKWPLWSLKIETVREL
jgi:hypothetical protein